ncbi:MAG: TonB-dependent receptor [Ignavibacteriales bacterium]|nr:TonB-dependent receptor [Ignavibacteriales bacterium]
MVPGRRHLRYGPPLQLLQQELHLERPDEADRGPVQGHAHVGFVRQQLVQLPRRDPEHQRHQQQGLRRLGSRCLEAGRVRLPQPERGPHVRLQRQQQLPGQRPRRLRHVEHDQPADRQRLHARSTTTPAATCTKASSTTACSTTPAPSTTPAAGRSSSARSWKSYSANLDLSYYVSLGGEHAWKAGAQIIRDQEDYANSAAYPMVNLYWDRSCSALTAYGVPTFRGTYGYYYIRGSWTSPYGYQWDIGRNSYALYLQDSWTIGGRLTLNAGVRTEIRVHPVVQPRFPRQAHQVRLRRQARPPAGRRLRRLRGFHPQGLRQLRHLLRRHEALHGRRRLRRLQVDQRLLQARQPQLLRDRRRVHRR